MMINIVTVTAKLLNWSLDCLNLIISHDFTVKLEVTGNNKLTREKWLIFICISFPVWQIGVWDFFFFSHYFPVSKITSTVERTNTVTLLWWRLSSDWSKQKLSQSFTCYASQLSATPQNSNTKFWHQKFDISDGNGNVSNENASSLTAISYIK